MKKLILCSLFIILTSCTAAPTAPVANNAGSDEFQTKAVIEKEVTPEQSMKRKAKSCICTKIFMPVCGEDNKTYGNSCEADCAGVKYTGGACTMKK